MWRFTCRPAWVGELNRKLDKIMATQEENQAQLNAFAAQAVKAKAEILAQLAALEEAATAGQTLDFEPLRTAVGDLDDINPDAVLEE